MSYAAQRLGQLYELGLLRRAEEPPAGCTRIGDYHKGAYESKFVSPYSKSAGNPEADVMIVLQDWASREFLAKGSTPDPELQQLGMKPNLPTNKRLRSLLGVTFPLELESTFATNAFPFVKSGRMSAPIGPLVALAHRFVFPQIEIVQPQIVICLGFKVFNAVAVVLGEKRGERIGESIGKPIVRGERTYWCQAHPGGFGASNRKASTGKTDVFSALADDWRHMQNHLKQHH